MNEFIYLLVMTAWVLLLPPLRKSFVPIPTSSSSNKTLHKESGGRYQVFDMMRGIAIIAVIVIHVTYLFPLADSSINVAILQSVDASMRFALPIFYITSGVLIIAPKNTFQGVMSFYWKRVVSIIPPYLLVTGALAVIEKLSWDEFLYNVFTGNGSVPFYFVIVLLQLYLVYPLIERWTKNRWFVFFIFFVSLLAQFQVSYWYIFDVPMAFRFLFFFVWGIYMKNQFLEGTLSRKPAPWVGMIALCVLVYAVYPGQYFNMHPFYGVAMTVVLFLFFTAGKNFRIVEKLFAWTGSMSLWVFLTHFPLMEYVLPLYWRSVSLPTIMLLVTSCIISIVASIAFGYVCMKGYNSAVLVLKGNVKRTKI